MTKQPMDAAHAQLETLRTESTVRKSDSVLWQARPRLSDRQWAQITAVLPGRVGARAHNGGNAKLYIEAVLWVAQTHAYWSDIPAEYGHWHTIYIRFGRWCDERLWAGVITALDGMPEAQTALRNMVEKYCASVNMRRQRRRLRG